MSKQQCGRTEAEARLVDAEDFLIVAALSDNPDVAVSNAALAGIAAADTICCLRLGHHSRGSDHGEAVKLLQAAKDRSSATQLQRLLSVKTKAQYDHRSLAASEADKALNRAQRLVQAARDALVL